MNDTATHTVRVADIATTGQDRIDGPLLLDAIRAALDEHGAVRLSFRDMSCVTPSLINEAMVPLLEDASIETLRTQVLLVDTTRHVADTVRRCMEHGVRWNAGEFAATDVGSIGRLPVFGVEKDESGQYRPTGEMHVPDRIPAEQDPFQDSCDMDVAAFGRMLDEDQERPLDLGESAFDRMMRSTLRDHGITVIRCGDERRDIMAGYDSPCLTDLPKPGFDHRSKNRAPRSYRRR